MEFRNFIINPSLAAFAVAGAFTVGCFIWWLVRKRQKTVWLPTIRIMRLESQILPKLSLRQPPLVPFLCFLVAAAAIVFFSLRPTTQVFTPFEPNQTRIHIFVDMSPSVSAHLTLEEYRLRVAQLYEGLKDVGRISLSTSHSSQIFEPKSSDEVMGTLKKYDFHRVGMRLGAVMKVLLDQLGQVDRLFIVSDRDQHSWSGFNWQYLLDEMAVNVVDVSRGNGAEGYQNIFIQEARYLSAPSSATMEWDVEIARLRAQEATQGQLIVRVMGKELAQVPWKMAAGKARQTVRVEWSQTDVRALDGGLSPDVPLVFEIVSPDSRDFLEMDNTFRSLLKGIRSDVTLIGETGGERSLEDPLHQLQVTLEILGFKSRRFDYIKQPGPAVSHGDFFAIAGGSGLGTDRFCPRSVEALLNRAKGEARREISSSLEVSGMDKAKIWLFPLALESDYRELCQCYARLLQIQGNPPGGNHRENPSFCQNVTSRSQWVGLLKSLGAKQLGGDIGEAHGALAFHQTDRFSGLEVVAFTIPLMPLKATGVTYGTLPILIKEVLTWQGLLEQQNLRNGSGWPRADDIVSALWTRLGDDLAKERLRMRQSNVPAGESFLSEIEIAELPPRWTPQMDWSVKQTPSKKDREDPIPWLKLCGWTLVLSALTEAIWGMGRRLWRTLGLRQETILLLLFVPLLSQKVEARVEFSLLGYGQIPLETNQLAKEVSQRTSIELTSKPFIFARVSEDALAEPWLWVRDVSIITGPSGKLLPQLFLWLKRGGFLVIESQLSTIQLAKLTSDLLGQGGRWLPMPPDHEMMRSFYLLDALPDCNGEIWQGFTFDGRLAILSVPFGFLQTLVDKPTPSPCSRLPDQERATRIFVNLTMVALATDYKKDQIHLPEILKRLR